VVADTHIETVRVQGRRLGRRPHDPDRPVLHLSQILTGQTPTHPVAVDHFSKVTDWGLYTNDKYGVCGPTSVANSRKLTTRYLTTAEQSPALVDVYDLYRRSGNPTFNPATGAGDNGVDMATMLSAVRHGGIGGVHSLAEAKVNVANLDEVRAAIDIFGFLLLGVNLETAQQTETTLWDYVPSGEWGGHAVLTGVYTSKPSNDVEVVSWAERIGVTDTFWEQQVEEAWVVIWPELATTAAFEQSIDKAALNAAWDRPFVHPPPRASPTDPSDRALEPCGSPPKRMPPRPQAGRAPGQLRRYPHLPPHGLRHRRRRIRNPRQHRRRIHGVGIRVGISQIA
jgi:hypothetical protein